VRLGAKKAQVAAARLACGVTSLETFASRPDMKTAIGQSRECWWLLVNQRPGVLYLGCQTQLL
jgi:hypothetical protein